MSDLAYLGCIACQLENRVGRPAQVHHLVEGNKRLGHRYTLGLCPWHHVGEEQGIMSNWGMKHLGPSVHKHKRAFEERYGTQRELLTLQDRLLEAWRKGWIPGQIQILSEYRQATLYSD